MEFAPHVEHPLNHRHEGQHGKYVDNGLEQPEPGEEDPDGQQYHPRRPLAEANLCL